jgi:hypothetical protein
VIRQRRAHETSRRRNDDVFGLERHPHVRNNIEDAGALFALPVAGTYMRYMVAWLSGVPSSVIVLWYSVGHAACGH